MDLDLDELLVVTGALDVRSTVVMAMDSTPHPGAAPAWVHVEVEGGPQVQVAVEDHVEDNVEEPVPLALSRDIPSV